jgi:non-homologous end joining protein Ku
VDLAALSLSGSLVPSVPTQLMVKYNPPSLTVLYHFEQKSNDQYFHQIDLDPSALDSKTAEEIVSYLYMAEAYYFNPKQVKRAQLIRLVELIQEKRKEQGNAQGGRKKNFFERKRFLNYG